MSRDDPRLSPYDRVVYRVFMAVKGCKLPVKGVVVTPEEYAAVRSAFRFPPGDESDIALTMTDHPSGKTQYFKLYLRSAL